MDNLFTSNFREHEELERMAEITMGNSSNVYFAGCSGSYGGLFL